LKAIANGIVVDASVALAWCFPDEESAYAHSVLVALENQTVLVPAIWSVEIANALVVGERRKRIRRPEMRRFIELLKVLRVVEDRQVFTDAIDNFLALALLHKLTAYDAAYLDLAVRFSAPLATVGRELQKAARAAGISIFEA
jgi:predicted nucleic acid-binding protein